MADVADQADGIIEAELASRIQAARTGQQGPFSGLRPKGECWWCGEHIPADRLHCAPADDSCAEDHARYQGFNKGMDR